MSAAQTPETHSRAATPRRAGLAASVVRVREHLARLPWSFAITIADNASTSASASASASADGTTVVARRLAHAHPEVRVLHLAEKGRGRGLVSGRLPLAEVSERLGRASADAGGGRLGLQLGIFAIIGVVSTVAYASLYLLLRGIVDPLWANAAALLVTALGNTAANRRFTFGVRGRAGVVRHQAQGSSSSWSDSR